MIRDIAIVPRVETVFAVTASNLLVSFNSLTPGTILSTVPIFGLQSGESIVGIDFRPAGGQLFALGSSSRLYTINTVNGGATPVSASTLDPALNGTAFGFDFNPVPDRIRVVSTATQNLRLNPNNGAVAGTDTALTFNAGDPNASAAPNAVGAAYTNNFAGTPSTTLFVIDSNLDILARQGSPGGTPDSPNGGKLDTIGPLGVNTTNDVGFDISDCSGTGYASLTTAGGTQSQFYGINLLNGAATAVGAIGVNEVIRDIAVATNFVPSAQSAGLAVVNAASFIGDVVAPESIAAMFGSFQTLKGQIAAATTAPLPTTLGGITVSVNGVVAGLFFVSNGQINFLVPPSVPDGMATVTVTNANGTTRTGTVNIVRAAPGVISANSTGTGTAAGLTTFDGVTFLSLLNPDGSERAVDPGTKDRPNFLILYATGLRRTPAANPGDANGVAEAVSVTIQGVPVTPTFVGPVSGLEGVDQLNVPIPPELAGQGKVSVRLVTNGQASNVVTFTIGGTAPQVNTQPAALGQTIAGSLTVDDQILSAGDGSGRTYFFDSYRFTATAGTSVALDFRSLLFDPAVLLYQRSGDGTLTLIAADDQLGGLGDGGIVNNNALLLTVLPATGDYVIFVTSSDDNPGATGGYTLRLIGNAVQPIGYGATLTAAISGSDLQTSAGDFIDAYSFAGVKDERAQIKMSSATFDSFLILNQADGQIVAFDDNSGGGTAGQDAMLTATLPATGVYVIIATPLAPFTTGSYTLSLTRVTTATAGETELTGGRAAGRTLPMRSTKERETQFERFAARRVIGK